MQSILLHEIWIYYLGSSLFIVSLFIFFIIIKKHIPSSSIEETYNRITTNEKSLIHPPLLIEQGTRIKILSTDKEIFLYGFYRIYLYLQQTYINSLVLSVVIGPYLTIYMFVQAFFPHWTESMKEKIYKKII